MSNTCDSQQLHPSVPDGGEKDQQHPYTETDSPARASKPMRVAVIGSGAAGLSAAWLLSKKHAVVLYEACDWLGGHAHSACIDEANQQVVETNCGATPSRADHRARLMLDTGFIVYNEATYPNFTAWMQHLQVRTQATNMSFAVSRDDGAFEYAGGPLPGLFAQKSNLFKVRFWRMLGDIVRFYREAVEASSRSVSPTLGEFLHERNYSQAFIDDHLLPFGAAIWSTPQDKMLAYPLRSFVRFCDNHGLLKIAGRPQWRTVTGGSVAYVQRVVDEIVANGSTVHTSCPVVEVRRDDTGVRLLTDNGDTACFDHVVLACHADQALTLLQQASETETRLLGEFAYEANRAVLHTDEHAMPKRRAAWSSWNYVESATAGQQSKPGVVYWMNRLQNLPGDVNYFVSLNPQRRISPAHVLRETLYHHPLFNHQTYTAQKALWDLQGNQGTWFCGSYFGSGFHEDAIQAGLAVAEALGGMTRPWTVESPSSRIFLSTVASTDAQSHSPAQAS